MSFHVAQATDIWIASAGITARYRTWGDQGWQGNTRLQTQPVGPLPTVSDQQSRRLVSTPGSVYVNENGSYTIWVTVTNLSPNQSDTSFAVQISSD
jgi:hypothetical protein